MPKRIHIDFLVAIIVSSFLVLKIYSFLEKKEREERLHREIEIPWSHRIGTFWKFLLIASSRRLEVKVLG